MRWKIEYFPFFLSETRTIDFPQHQTLIYNLVSDSELHFLVNFGGARLRGRGWTLNGHPFFSFFLCSLAFGKMKSGGFKSFKSFRCFLGLKSMKQLAKKKISEISRRKSRTFVSSFLRENPLISFVLNLIWFWIQPWPVSFVSNDALNKLFKGWWEESFKFHLKLYAVSLVQLKSRCKKNKF